MRSSRVQGGNGKPVFAKTSDGELLSRWLKSADEAAFRELYERHKQMVSAVCARILHHRHDAEAASQKTFLVLTRNAAKVDLAKSVEAWLHGIAVHVALVFRRNRNRRRAHEIECGERQITQIMQIMQIMQITQPLDHAEFQEFFCIVNEELQRLPEKYRVPFVLKRLEGKSRSEVAQELGLPEGTVASRVRKARELLQQQLARRGIVPPR